MAIIVIFIGGDIGNLLTKKYISLEEKNAEFITSENVTIGLQGILTICTQCEKIRDKSGNWIPIESYIQSRSEIKFSHSLCENCAENLYGNEDWYLSLKDR